MPLGTMYGVGVGPGDPELLTLKGLRRIRECDVLAYPAPETGDSLARSIVAGHLPGGQVEIPIRMPMVASRFPAQEVYSRASAELAEHLEAGRNVAVLCEGDPFFFGSFSFLFARMAERYPVEVVPGVSSLTASAAALGAPLATRNDVLSVVPATLDDDTLRARIGAVEAVAIIKVGRHLARVRNVLVELGLEDDAHYIQHATMATERTLRLADVSESAAPYFSMILVHRRGRASNL